MLIDIIGAPLDLYREKEIIRATSMFGVYLGTVAQSSSGDVAIWTVALATIDLAIIPQTVAYRVGGKVEVAQIVPKKWIHGPLYSEEELPKPRPRYKSVSSSDEEVVPLTKGMLRELCLSRDPATLPAAIREFLDGELSPVIDHPGRQPSPVEDRSQSPVMPARQGSQLEPQPVTPTNLRILRREATENPGTSAQTASEDKSPQSQNQTGELSHAELKMHQGGQEDGVHVAGHDTLASDPLTPVLPTIPLVDDHVPSPIPR